MKFQEEKNFHSGKLYVSSAVKKKEEKLQYVEILRKICNKKKSTLKQRQIICVHGLGRTDNEVNLECVCEGFNEYRLNHKQAIK